MIKRLAPILTVLVLLAGASSASAATFVVNDSSDLPDLDQVGGYTPDAICDVDDDGGPNCTLRAAIQEANDTPAVADTIHFALPAGTTITAETILPSVSGPTALDGCSGSGATGPCVGVRTHHVPNTARISFALGIASPDVSVSGLAITNAEQGIFIGSGAPGTVVRNSWIGLKLDGTVEANQRGIQVTPDSVVIGGTTPAQRNVISGNQTGISVFTGDNTLISGNYIGTNPEGTEARTNTAGIRLSGRGTSTTIDRPTNTTIGGTLTQEQQNTPACDGPCNLIAGSTGSGISMARDGAESSAPATVRIAGNYIGVDRTGASALAPIFGIEVGQADDATIGGATFAERNLVTGVQRGITTDDVDARNLEIRSNWVGTTEAGDAKLGALQHGAINVRSTGADPAAITGNLAAIGDRYGVRVAGSNAVVNANYIGIGAAGTEDVGSSVATADGVYMHYNPDGRPQTSANAIVDNRIGNAGRAGIHIEGSFANTMDNNKIGTDGEGHEHPNGRYGILLESTSGSPARLNEMGTAIGTPGNEISNNPAAGIRIPSASAVANTIDELSGTNNGTDEAFGAPGMIDLGPEGPGNLDGDVAHGGIQAPRIVVAARGRVVGTGSPGATVRIYEKSGDGLGELSGLDLTTTVGTDGVWQAAYGSPQDAGQRVTATQTLSQGNPFPGTSEFGNVVRTLAGTGGSAIPQTTIAGPALTNDPAPSFDLGSDLPEGGYICRFISVTSDTGGFYRECDDPYATGTLLEGTGYRLLARAISTDGFVDPEPAEHVFTIDLTAPAAPQITGGPEGPTDDATPTFTFAGEAGNELRCAIDGGAPQSCTGEFTPGAALAPGGHEFAVVQVDPAGNASAPATRAFTVTAAGDQEPDADRRAPETEITKAAKRKLRLKAGKRKAKVKLAFRADQAGATFTCTVDRGAAKPCTSPAKLKLKPGKHTIAIAATDRAGNTDRTPAIAKVKVKKARG